MYAKCLYDILNDMNLYDDTEIKVNGKSIVKLNAIYDINGCIVDIDLIIGEGEE